jgi:hypothetical protein
MEFEQIISTLTIVSTLSVKLIGFPAQMLKVKKAGHLEGVSVLYFVLGFVTYSLWTLHGYFKHDTTVMFGQGVGVLASGALLVVLFTTAQKAKKGKR